MPARVTVPEAARANARLLQAASLRHLGDAEAEAAVGVAVDAAVDADGRDEARALLRLDRQQRFERIDARLATDEEDALLSVCG